VDRRAEFLARLIDEKGSRRAFAEEIGLPPTTLQSMLTRGIGKASIDNVIKVCKALGVRVEDLDALANGDEPETIAAHFEGEEWTEEELETIEKFKQFVKSQRKQQE